MVSQSGAVLGS